MIFRTYFRTFYLRRTFFRSFLIPHLVERCALSYAFIVHFDDLFSLIVQAFLVVLAAAGNAVNAVSLLDGNHTTMAGDFPCAFDCTSGMRMGCGGTDICCPNSAGGIGCASNVPTCSCDADASYLSFKWAWSGDDRFGYMSINYGSYFTIDIPRNDRFTFAFFLNPEYRYSISYTRSNSGDPLPTVSVGVCDDMVEERNSCVGRGNLGSPTSLSICPGTSCTQTFDCNRYQELLVQLDNNNDFFEGKLCLTVWVSRSLVSGDPCGRNIPTVLPTNKPTIFPTHYYTPRPTEMLSPITESSGMEEWAFWLLVVACVVFAGGFIAFAIAFFRYRKAHNKEATTESSALLPTTFTADQAATAPSQPSAPSQSLSV